MVSTTIKEKMESNQAESHLFGNSDNDVSFEDLVQNEHNQKERALMRISQAKRERSGSNLQLEKIAERPSRYERIREALDYEDEDDDEDPDMPDNDLRKALFEAIPEPYPHTLNYQKVVITEAGDPIDQDTKDACLKLKKCMDIRNKWIGAHPFPPQDAEFPTSAPCSPDRPSRKGTSEHYRRRLPPSYEIFGVPLPPPVHHLRFKMVDGVVRVAMKTPSNNSTHAISVGLSLSTDESPDQAQEGILTSELKATGANEAEEEGVDWGRSIYPVFGYSEYVNDYNYVSTTPTAVYLLIYT